MRVNRMAAALLAAVLLALAAPAALAADKAPVARAAANPNLAARARQRVPEFPPDVKALGDKLKNIASPTVRSWAAQNATAIAQGSGDPETVVRAAAQARWPNFRVPAVYDALTFLVLYEAGEVLQVNVKNLQAALKNALDSMSELGEMESLRLQMAMDRLSKLMTTLSNLLKKISSTDESIVQNMK